MKKKGFGFPSSQDMPKLDASSIWYKYKSGKCQVNALFKCFYDKKEEN